MRNTCVLIALLTSMTAEPDRLDVPRIGFWRSADGTIRQLDGIRGNLIGSRVWLKGAVSAASSGRRTLVKTGDSILALDAGGEVVWRLEAPPGRASFAFTSAGEPARAYFHETSELIQLPDGLRAETPPDPVVALSESAMVVRRGESMWLIRDDGSESPLTGARDPVALLPDASPIYFDGVELIASGRLPRRIRLPQPPEWIEPVGPGWLHVRTSTESFAVFLGEEGPELFGLPAGRR